MTRLLIPYGATFTPGTKVASGTSGFQVPKGYAGVLGIAYDGAGMERFDITFPGQEHPFSLEEVPVLGEIAVHTRVENQEITPCFWRLGEFVKLDVTPQGAGAAAGDLYIIFGTSDEFTHPPIHWEHYQATHGTTTDGTKMIDIPPALKTVRYVMSHGAGSQYSGLKFQKAGQAYKWISNHQATNAAEIPVEIRTLNLPKESDQILFVDDSGGYTGTDTLEIYFGMTQ